MYIFNNINIYIKEPILYSKNRKKQQNKEKKDNIFIL